jgi:metallophosphoesterase (TIGR03767 family)
MMGLSRGLRRLCGAILLSATTAAGVSVAIASPAPDTLGQSTLDQRIVPNSDADFRELELTDGEPYVVREEGVGTAHTGRVTRRTSLAYFGQLTDFQLADEESPARVEFIDTGPFSAAWRPWEALNPQIDDAMIRQVNAFASASPVADGAGGHRSMDLTLTTGDSADSQQRNETEWVRTLLEGGNLNPGSGIDPENSDIPACAAAGTAGVVADGDAPENYTGVQDPDDYQEGPGQFYFPDSPSGAFAAWPEYDGLLDRAQKPFDATGLDVPSYVAFGNHDALVQGNAFANRSYEDVATGCVKPMGPLVADNSLADALGALDQDTLADLLSSDPGKVNLVPPDPNRQYVSKAQYKEIFEAGSQADGHGFGRVDPDEEEASNGAAGYYAWSPLPGFRFIALDTVSEAGVIGPSADGNIDDPQYQWLQDQLEEATDQDQLVVLFSHHAIPSLTADVPDEMAGPCEGDDGHGHGENPGCDLDPRSSEPIRLGDDMESLLFQYPHVIAWVAGHSHVNAIEPHSNPAGGGFWSIRVAAEADWPQQTRLLEIFDNEDGTLSIFGTIVDHASDATAPASGADVAAMDENDLASIGRTLAANDTQLGAPQGEGDADDRNVELLVKDPRDGDGGACSNAIRGTRGPDTLNGTANGDDMRGRRGDDELRGHTGADCVRGGRDDDVVRGDEGHDNVRGGSGRDRVIGGDGEDELFGGARRDHVVANDGVAETVACGRGRDVAIVDPSDTPQDCEKVKLR